jgi:tetratricopeptide (TPR) repeat protein
LRRDAAAGKIRQVMASSLAQRPMTARHGRGTTLHARRVSRPGGALILVLGLIHLAPVALAAAPVHDDPQMEAVVDGAVRRCVDFIYDGQLDSATAAIEAAAALSPGDPRIGLFRFRCLRENYPDDINEETRARRLAPRLLAPLDWSIGRCDSMLERRDNEEAAYLYRGWAHMMKAQTHAIATQIWAAGGESRRAKNDLETYMKKVPNDKDAGVIVGGYLYFADILPKVVKFLKFFARVPSGDRERGLKLLEAGTEGNGYTAVDTEVVLAVIEYFFEGRLEEAEASFVSLGERYPYNPRVNELLGSIAIFHPEASMRAIDAQTRILDGWGTRVRGWDPLFRHRLLWARARVWGQVGDYEAARRDLTEIADAAPSDPYWITPRALLGLAHLAAHTGEGEQAVAYAERVLAKESWSRYHESAQRYVDRRTGQRQQDVFHALAAVRRALYGRERDPEAAKRQIEEIRAKYGEDPRLTYLEAELHRSLGDRAEARRGYEQLVADGNDGGFESTRLLSLMRLGELDLAERRFDDATERYEEAREIEPGSTHLANMIRGRLHFIDVASKGKGS